MYRNQKIAQVLWITLGLNLMVACLKLIYGYFSHSLSLEADGFHSLFDSASNVIGFISLKLAIKPPDADHPYGHQKIETLATMGVALLLFAAGYEIINGAIDRFNHPVVPIISVNNFIVMIFTMVVNLWVSSFEKKKGKELQSDFLLADAIHTRSDFFISLSVLISFVAILLHLVFLDIIIACGIVIVIGFVAYSILNRSIHVLLDTQSLNPDHIRSIVMSVTGMRSCHKIRSRGSGAGIFVDLHIQVDPQMTLDTAHRLTHKVIETIKKEFPLVVDVLIHTEPAYPK
ncbi:MAG: hypothetical protein A3G32_09235 [Deltaproteobacteria bacterium RIFCSPLOWO2_12_FULL_40_28]|nr:MAG: hypothetical protein A3C45_08090 [Deltaproteobacteria bacterium RIFCSPHIGHO2_02_FULL_40_28]OGQ21204.1 MAG: hypothetical protein A3E27_01725 [Deltaproteobacteria bacterium RIFCSPHIGHO2_12_FULL_40_32]OGQ39105.1 MAG: hypothetical protein A3I69_09360 [Deltaproteobacteria bacterium RIFCSPLOWO2_02_FULL_40_36]OGQ53178.1 MAG: hypothetical protein A3G32_09235 [Deltaproteobacteria bacterium RIFCSPLOWO2_12_FULL_40_28]